jgi:two-component system, NtrC family, sensor kinase
VWTNLVHNAIQAMEGKGTLTIHLRQEQDTIVVQFTDSGCGIPEDLQAKIFNPFFTTKPIGEGSGIGLSIIQRIIEQHKGTISLTSSQPGKTTFTVTLPINYEGEDHQVQEA